MPHIYADSKAHWHSIIDDYPQFAEGKSVTSRLNATYSNEASSLDREITKMQHASIDQEDWGNNGA